MIANQLKTGAILTYVLIGLSNLIALLYTPYMLRMMGQNEYGLYSLVASVIAYLTILDFGFGNAVIRYTAKFRAEGKIESQYSMFGMFIVLYSLIGIIALVLGLSLYFNVDSMFSATMSVEDIAKVRIMMLLMIFNLAITFPFSIFSSIINAYEKFIYQQVVQIIRIILNTAIMIVLLKYGFRAIGMVVLATIFNISTLLLNYAYCKHKIKIKIYFHSFEWGLLKEVSIYSFYIFLNILMDRIYWSSGQFVLGALVGTTAVAVFSVAIKLETMYMSYSSAISGVFLPKVTGIVMTDKSEKTISDLFIRTGRIQFAVLAYVLTGFIVFGKQFIMLWAGEDYSDVYVIALIFMVPLTVPLIQTLGIIILQARNQMKFRSVLYILIALCSLALQIPLSKHYGGIGAAIGVSAGLVLGQIITMNIYYYKKQGINIPTFWKEIFKMSLTPLILGVSGYLLLMNIHLYTVPRLAFGIGIFSVFYVPSFWLFSLNQSERNLTGIPVINLARRFRRQ